MNIPHESACLNLDKRTFDGVGEYEFPSIAPIDMDISGAQMIGFHFAKSDKEPRDKILHFYVDDYQFERVWNNPDTYLPLLKRYKAVCSPDFSMYTDFPRAMSMFNHYRKQWCGAYWQEQGIKVIPTIGWIEPDSFDFVFDGIPHNALVCISTLGTFNRKELIDKWLTGYHAALEVLKPKKILFYGKLYPQIEVPEGIEYSVAVNQNMARLAEIRDRRRREAKAKRAEIKS